MVNSYLTIEKHINDEHVASLVVEQSEIQAYIVGDLHCSPHGHLNTYELPDYIDQLVTAGFEEVGLEDINKERPHKYYILLSKDNDWNIREILVFNNFHRYPRLMELVEQLDLGSLANFLLVEKWEETKYNWIDPKRNNFQVNFGRNHVDQTDSTTIPGMNIPQHHKKPVNFPGLDNDDNLEETLFKKQSINTQIMDIITMMFLGRKIFVEEERLDLLTKPDMLRRGLDEDAVRSDAGVFFYNGLFYNRSPQGCVSANLHWHTDGANDYRTEGGSNLNYCFNQIIKMDFDNRSNEVLGRAALTMYQKQCVGDLIARRKATMRFAEIVKRYIEDRNGLNTSQEIDWVGKMELVHRQCDEDGNDFATLPADANKDCYNSWFIDILFEKVFPVYGWNIYVLVEFLFCLTLTPSPIGFKRGVEYALNASSNNNKNFVYNFIKEMVFHHKAVAYHFDTKGRYQVSSQGLLSHHAIQLSLINLLSLIQYANNTTSDSKKLYKTMAKKPDKGGVQGSGELVSLTIVKVATLVGAIRNQNHVNNISIPGNTETAKRLKNDYGIATEAHRRELLNKLVEVTGIENRPFLENCICEVLRMNSDNGSEGAENIRRNQPLYQLHPTRNGLKKTSHRGQESYVSFEDMYRRNGRKAYNPRYKWWEIRPDVPLMNQIGGDYDEVLTMNSKLVQDYMMTHNDTS